MYNMFLVIIVVMSDQLVIYSRIGHCEYIIINVVSVDGPNSEQITVHTVYWSFRVT